MKLVDEAAGLAAITYARRRVATVSIDRMDFLVPISVGELVTFRASVNVLENVDGGRVRVEAETPIDGRTRPTNTACLTMVALDEHAHPTPVPSPLAVSAEEQRRLSQAALRRSNRLTERRQMLAHQPDLGS